MTADWDTVHYSPQSMATALRRVVERLDRMDDDDPIARVHLSVDFQIVGDFDEDVARRQKTVERIAAALGLSVEFNTGTKFYSVPYHDKNRHGVCFSVFGEMPAPSTAIAEAASFADVEVAR